MLDKKSPPSATDAAAYVRDMAQELRTIAAASGLDFLAYLLGMAADEAEVAAWGPAALDDRAPKPRLVKAPGRN